jgi:class 3 adenylate cyclase
MTTGMDGLSVAGLADLAGSTPAGVERLVDAGILAARDGTGQVLVSASVAESAAPEGVAFLESGEVRLKGFARPVRLLEVVRA